MTSAALAPKMLPSHSLPLSATSPGPCMTLLLSLPLQLHQKTSSSVVSLPPSIPAMMSSALLATKPGIKLLLTKSSTPALTTLAMSTSTDAKVVAIFAALLTSASDLTLAVIPAGLDLIAISADQFHSASRLVPSPTPEDDAETDVVFAHTEAAAPVTAASPGHPAMPSAGSPTIRCADASDLCHGAQFSSKAA